jgi:hypothetical protein
MGSSQQETITLGTLIITLVLSGSIAIIPRKYLLLPFAVAACWVPADQRIVIQTLDFHVLQILVLVGAARLWIYGEAVRIRWNRFDRLILIWAAVGTLVYVAQWGNLAAVIYKSGRLLEWLGLYWIFRQTVRSWDDLRFTYLVLAVCALAMMPFVALERVMGSNPFAVLGRVITAVREGSYRCQATFPHSIIMGLFWATLVPLFVGFARQRAQYRSLFWAAVGASTFMIMMTASSTPVLTLMAAAGLLLAYPYRRYTGTAAWGVVAMLVALHIVMKAPVWHLLSRISVVSGSTGWHRYFLINQAVEFFGEWALLGTRDTAHWGTGLGDVTNELVLVGVQGGLVTLIVFCIVLFVMGRALARLSIRSTERTASYLAWCTFVTVLAHFISFFGVSYFGQIAMPWYLLLASAGYFYGEVYAPVVPVGPPVRSTPVPGLQRAYR